MTRRLITTAAAAGLLLLTGCNTTDTASTTGDTQTATATAKPSQDPEQVAQQVISYYERELEYTGEDGLLTDDATDIATYSWIDARNKNARAILVGENGTQRTWKILEITVEDHQVEYFATGTADAGSPNWTIVLNLCVMGREDYREEDGTVITPPDEEARGPERVTAQYDGPAKDWKLTAFEYGDPEACGLPAPGDDSAQTTAPAGGDETEETTAP